MPDHVASELPEGKNRAKRLKDKYNKMNSARKNWESYWQEVLELTMPRKAFITRSRIVGDRLEEDVYDSTAIRANQILAAGLQGNLTNPAQRWFRLRLQQPVLNDIQEVKLWLADTEDKIFDILNSSNFNQQIHEAYLDLGSAGTAVMFMSDDPIDLIRFSTIPIREVVIAENGEERIDIVFRKYKLTARQAFERWGEDAGKNVIEAITKRSGEQKIDFLHAVLPRNSANPRSSRSEDLPIASIHVNWEEDKIVRESGFEEFPYFTTRFLKVAGDVYGHSPGTTMLPDIKMLNAVSKTIIKASQKVVDPPILLPHDGFMLPFKLTPGGVNFKTSGTPQDRIEFLQSPANLPVGREFQQDLREQINSGFFVDLFLALLDKRNMTATEVAERVSERMVMLGPTLGRLQSEMLDPVVERSFGIALRRGLLAQPPDILQQQDLVIEYISPLALAQKREGVNAIASLLTLTGSIAGFDPQVVDKINSDKIIDEAADRFGVTPDIVRDAEQVAAIREQRQAVQEQTELAASIGQAAEVARTGAQADKANAEAAATTEGASQGG